MTKGAILLRNQDQTLLKIFSGWCQRKQMYATFEELPLTQTIISIVLFTVEMIEFIERHCGRNTNKLTIHVDTTYNLTYGFAVICILRPIDFEGDPLLLGPILVTKRQRECDISILYNTIIKANSKFLDLDFVFVTNGDDSIVSLSTQVIPRATHAHACSLEILLSSSSSDQCM